MDKIKLKKRSWTNKDGSKGSDSVSDEAFP